MQQHAALSQRRRAGHPAAARRQAGRVQWSRLAAAGAAAPRAARPGPAQRRAHARPSDPPADWQPRELFAGAASDALPFSRTDSAPGQQQLQATGEAPVARAQAVPRHILAQQEACSLLESAAPADVPGLAHQLVERGPQHVVAALNLLAGMRTAAGRQDAARREAAAQLVQLLAAGLRQAGLACQTPATVASTCFALARTGHYEPQVMQQIEQRSLALLGAGSFKANQLGQLSQGFLGLDHRPGEAWVDAWLAATADALADSSPTQLASIGEAAAAWRCPGAGTSADSSVPGLHTGLEPAAAPEAAAAAPPPAAADGTSAAVTVGTTAAASSGLAPQLGPHPATLQVPTQLPASWLAAYRDALGLQLPACRPPQLARVMQALAGMTAAQPPQQQLPGLADLLVPLMRRAEEVLPDTTPAELAAMLQALARLLQPPPPALPGAAPPPTPQQQQQLTALCSLAALQLEVLLPLSDGSALVASLVALLRLGWRPPRRSPWAPQVLLRLLPLLCRLRAPELADLGWALGQLRLRPHRQWWLDYGAALRLEARDMALPGALACLGGLAEAGLKLDPEVLHLFVNLLRSRLGVMSGGQLQEAAAALRAMYAPRALPGRSTAQLVQEMERRARYQ